MTASPALCQGGKLRQLQRGIDRDRPNAGGARSMNISRARPLARPALPPIVRRLPSASWSGLPTLALHSRAGRTHWDAGVAGGTEWESRRSPALVDNAQGDANTRDVKKVVLAYSGGLDTSIILKWLQTTYRLRGRHLHRRPRPGRRARAAREKALLLGIKPQNIFVEDLREEFVRDYVFPMFRADALYEGQYLLGTSIARPLIAKQQIEIAEKVGADAVAHGATGKGNDQVRFELTYYALKPDVTVIAPWREWDMQLARGAHRICRAAQIPIAKDKRGEAPFSVDANLLHASSEGKVLEDPSQEVPDYVYSRTVDPENAPDKPDYVTRRIRARRRRRARRQEALAGERCWPSSTRSARAHGIGRLDLVENRFVGMKSRGMYETPGGTILFAAHRGIESITLDRGAAHLKDELMPKYAELIYNGFWFTPEREMLQAAIDKIAGIRDRLGEAQALQGQRRGGGAHLALFALRSGPRHFRGGQGRLRPARRRRIHPFECAPAADAWPAKEEPGEVASGTNGQPFAQDYESRGTAARAITSSPSPCGSRRDSASGR